jgi:replicative superfamily II helicase
MVMSVHTALELSHWLRLVRTCSDDDMADLVSVLGLRECLPSRFLASLEDDADLTICYRTAIICYGVTCSVQAPREMQLKAILSDYCGNDRLVSVGTGSGKTLPIALNVLLDDPDKKLITLVLSPLKSLQVTQESDFNSRYGILTVVVNEDTPREDSWWNVSILVSIL